jgi:hypothetical protein
MPTNEARAELRDKIVYRWQLNGGELIDHAIAVVLEEAAKVATEYRHPNMAFYPPSVGIAAAIRGLTESYTQDAKRG